MQERKLIRVIKDPGNAIILFRRVHPTGNDPSCAMIKAQYLWRNGNPDQVNSSVWDEMVKDKMKIKPNEVVWLTSPGYDMRIWKWEDVDTAIYHVMYNLRLRIVEFEVRMDDEYSRKSSQSPAAYSPDTCSSTGDAETRFRYSSAGFKGTG